MNLWRTVHIIIFFFSLSLSLYSSLKKALSSFSFFSQIFALANAWLPKRVQHPWDRMLKFSYQLTYFESHCLMKSSFMVIFIRPYRNVTGTFLILGLIHICTVESHCLMIIILVLCQYFVVSFVVCFSQDGLYALSIEWIFVIFLSLGCPQNPTFDGRWNLTGCLSSCP